MERYEITFLPMNRKFSAERGTTVLDAMIGAGLRADAPCGGHGTCGKCRIRLFSGEERLACRTTVEGEMTVFCAESRTGVILTAGSETAVPGDGESAFALAFDVGTTTLVCYLMDGHSGQELAREGCMNPQTAFGADVISRIEYALKHGAGALAAPVREAMGALAEAVCRSAGISPDQVGVVSVAGNTAMHHLLLGIDPKPLTVPPYMPGRSAAMELAASEVLPVCCNAQMRVLPNIAGFVGADTVGCMVSAGFDALQELTLLIDIGTNGEMVLGDSQRRVACSAAAGPAFEGARIQCGMRGTAGAVDHVRLDNGELRFHVIGGGTPVGICGSGLLDLTAALLERGDLDKTGRMRAGKRVCLEGTGVFLSQKDVRQLQLAKAAIRAGIELLCREMDVRPEQIRRVYLAGAFGNYLDPSSACKIGMIPPVLEDRIVPIGNAAGAGAKLCALRREEFARSSRLASETEFLELASIPAFESCFVSSLNFT